MTRIGRWRWLRKVRYVSKKIILPGFKGKSLYDVTVFFFNGIKKGNITSRASSIAFNFVLAVFPMILVFFSLLPFIPVEGFRETLLGLIRHITPEGTEGIITSTLEDIIQRPRGGLLSLSFVLTLFFATNGFDSIIEAFNNTYHTIEKRSMIKQKLVSILLFFITLFIVIIATALLITGSSILKFLVARGILDSIFTYYILEFSRWLILVAIYFFTISFIYYLAPARESKFRFISPGSIFTTVLSLATSIGFNIYLQNFSRYNALYGSIGTLLIILIWIYINSLVLLAGFELNASIYHGNIGQIRNQSQSAIQSTIH